MAEEWNDLQEAPVAWSSQAETDTSTEESLSAETCASLIRQAQPLLDYLPTPYLILDEKLRILFGNYTANITFRHRQGAFDWNAPRSLFSKYLSSNLKTFLDWLLDEENEHGLEVRLCTTHFSNFILFKSIQKLNGEKLYHLICEPSEKLLLLHSDANVYKTVFNHADKAIFITDADDHIIAVNPRFVEEFGYELGDVYSRKHHFLFDHGSYRTIADEMSMKLQERSHWKGRASMRTHDKSVIMTSLSVIATSQSASSGINNVRVYIAECIKEQIKRENELKALASTDPLTRLYNRSAFNSYFANTFSEVVRTGESLDLMFVDLDNFKRLNDKHGHDYGDELLIKLSERLRSAVRSSDFIARLGGDEFIILIEGEASDQVLMAIAQKVLGVINTPFKLQDIAYKCSGSIGIARYPQDALQGDDLLRAADTAMYSAKNSGRNRYHFYDQQSEQIAQQGADIKDQISDALENGDIRAFYQPIHNLKTGQIVGFEALARLVLDQDDIRLPGYFMPHIQQDTLMVGLGIRIISLTFPVADLLHSRGLNCYLSINLSADQIRSDELIKHIELLARNHPGGSKLVKFEITEVVLFEYDEQVLSNIERIIALGFEIILDDFGTGYASIMSLKKFPFSAIKIDRNFVADIGSGNHRNISLLEGIISLLQSLQLDIVCEGIETQDQIDFLKDKGCQLGQGFYYAKALPKNKLIKYINDHE